MSTYLHHRDDGLLSIGQLSLPTNTKYLLVMYHSIPIGQVQIKQVEVLTHTDMRQLTDKGCTFVSASTMNRYS